MARLLLVRHGQTDWNLTGRYQGQHDTQLSEEGVRQAEALRNRLGEMEITAAYCSDLERARKTAEIIIAPHQLAVELVPAFRELSFGKFEGLTVSEMHAKYPAESALWLADRRNVRPPDGENLLDIERRVTDELKKLLSHHAAETVLIVAHGGPIRVTLCHLLHVDVKYFVQFHVDNASLTMVDTYPEGAVLHLHNDTCHLKGLL